MLDFREIIYLIITVSIGMLILMLNAGAYTTTDLDRVYRAARDQQYMEYQNTLHADLERFKNDDLNYQSTLNNIQIEQELYIRNLRREQENEQ
jgi:hypothetical protein